jgi:hypothetical protein
MNQLIAFLKPETQLQKSHKRGKPEQGGYLEREHKLVNQSFQSPLPKQAIHTTIPPAVYQN